MAVTIDRLCIIAALLLLAAVVRPIDLSSFGTCETCIGMLHLTSFSFLFGAQLWTTFVAGLVMIKTIPRHMFGLAQSALFPAYFGVLIMNGFLVLTAMIMRHSYSDWTSEFRNQAIAIGLVTVFNLVQRLWLAPLNTKIMEKMFLLEREVGAGGDIGPIDREELLTNPNYRQLKKQFGKFHGLTMLVGLLSLFPNLYHVYYLAQHIKM